MPDNPVALMADGAPAHEFGMRTAHEIVRAAVEEVPEAMWEQSLPTGSLTRISILSAEKRRFSYVSRCEIHGHQGNATVYVKLLRDAATVVQAKKELALQREFDALTYWHEDFKDSRQHGVAQPLFCLPERFLLVTAEVRGRNLYQVVTRDSILFPSETKIESLETHLRQVGGWIQDFQSRADSNASDSLLDLSEFREYVDLRLRALTSEKARRFPREYRDRILAFLDQRGLDIEDNERRVTPCHGDMNLGNIIVEDDNVTVLDLGTLSLDSFLADLAGVYHQLMIMSFKGIYRPKLMRRFQRALLGGYGAPECERLLMFRFMLVRHIVTHLASITRFWQQPMKERFYNRWVMRNELKILDRLIGGRPLSSGS